MNAIIKHHAEPIGLPAIPADPVNPAETAETTDLTGARIPHVSIHAFYQTDGFAETWSRAGRDRRLVSATTAQHPGGLAGAISLYRRERSPDLVIVEADAEGEDLDLQLDSLAEVCQANSRVIVIGRQNDIQVYRRLLGMGVSNYLVAPVGVGTVISAITELFREPSGGKIGRIAAVLGAKGGVGASSVAECLALELSNRRGSDVLLVDLDTVFGTAGLDLDIEPNQGLTELIRDAERIDTEMLDRVCVRRGANLAVLAAAAGLDARYEVDELAIERVLEVAQSHFRQIVLDVPHLWAPWVERALIAADDVLVVSTPELASLRNAVALSARVRSLRPNDRAPHLVLNQVGVPRRQEVTARDIARVLELEPAVTIPFDARSFSSAQVRGRLVAEIARRGPLAQAYARLSALVDPESELAPRSRRRRWLPGRKGAAR